MILSRNTVIIQKISIFLAFKGEESRNEASTEK